MITCDILGYGGSNNGLGNQLFCVATTLSLALDNSDVAVFPDLKKSHYKFYSRNIFHKLNCGTNKNFVKNYYKETPYTSTKYNKIPYMENMCLNGHFQSYKYFSHNEDYIRNLFTLPERLQDSISSRYSELLSVDNTVSLHIRRGDYVGDIFKDRYVNLNEEYYEQALSSIGEYSNIVVFSDDIQWCKNWQFLKDKDPVFIENEFDVVDLFLMSKMSHNIIANSTFSWWSAFLNNNINKKIVAPKEWFGTKRTNNNLEETKDLIPPDWVRI